MPRKQRTQHRKKAPLQPRVEPPRFELVASTLPGTEDMAKEELIRRSKGRVQFLPSHRTDECRFLLNGDTSTVLQLKLSQTIHAALPLHVRGPGSFMTPVYFKNCLSLIRYAINISGEDSWSGIRFDAAGSDSSTFQELGARLHESLGIPYRPDSGDLVITVRPRDRGWEFMCRIGSRPLSARPWRQANFRGALNATLASAIVELSVPDREDSFCNLMCGSGTILIERLLRRGASRVVGVDISRNILKSARANARAAGIDSRVSFIRATVEGLPLADSQFNVVCADLPWGEAVGDREHNAELYDHFFREAHRIAKPGARLIVLTLDTQTMKKIETRVADLFKLTESRKFIQRGYEPVCTSYTCLK
jgi:tRNA (guanine6-N2)-methyltransferase